MRESITEYDTRESDFSKWPLHDAVFRHLRVDWDKQACTVDLAVFLVHDERAQECDLIFSSLQELHLSHQSAWGETVSVNETATEEGAFIIRMRSGDTIRVIADRAILPRNSAA